MSKSGFMIHRQGRFDGACFLYSIVNAVDALSNYKKKLDAEWNKMVAKVPVPRDFLNGDCGTCSFDDNPLKFKSLFTMALGILNPNPNSEIIMEQIAINRTKEISNHIDENSVVIFATKSHWMVGVASDKSNIKIACSWVWFENDNYSEEFDEETKRYYNGLFSHKKKVVSSLVFKIKLEN